MLYAKARNSGLPIYSIFVPAGMKGYVFVEAAGPHFVDSLAYGIKHVKQRVPGIVNAAELERHLVRRPVIEELDVDDKVEIIAGPLKGMRARVTRVDKAKGEVTLELLDAAVTLPITVHASYVTIVEKAGRG
mgnify:CR=1 FL=1